ELEASDEQLDFPVVYASALEGKSSLVAEEQMNRMQPLYETIIEQIPAPTEDPAGDLQILVTLFDYNDFLGRIGDERVNRGLVKRGQPDRVMTRTGEEKCARIEKLFGFEGLGRVEIEQAAAGDIVAIAGIRDINIGETIADPENPE